MIICGQEFEFSALNANDLDRMDAAQQHMQAASDRESKRAHTGTADILRGQCRLMMGYFDELLGEGASERLGLDGNNFGACVRVTNAIKESIAAEQATVKQAAAMPMNREQRRAVAKQKKTGPYKVISTPKTTTESTFIRGQTEVSYGGEPDVVVPALTDEQKTEQLIDARQAVDALRRSAVRMPPAAAWHQDRPAERHV